MFIFISTFMFVFVYVCIHACVYTHTYIQSNTHTYIPTYLHAWAAQRGVSVESGGANIAAHTRNTWGLHRYVSTTMLTILSILESQSSFFVTHSAADAVDELVADGPLYLAPLPVWEDAPPGVSRPSFTIG